MNTTCLVLMSFLPTVPTVLHDNATVCEVNHVTNCKGEISFSQIIWWRWSWFDSEYHVAAWRHLSKAARPQRTARGWSIRFFDEKTKCERVVESSVSSETWANFDREVLERDQLPENERRGLSEWPSVSQ